MIRLGMKNCNMTLKEKQQKYQHSNSGKIDKYENLCYSWTNTTTGSKKSDKTN